MNSTIRLFKALPVENKDTAENADLMKITLAKGFIFSPEVIANYPDTKHLIELVDQAYGRSSEELNQTFHKSFAKVRDASIQQLVVEQIIHYFTTYGFEALGIYNSDSVYIPQEQLDVPELKDGIRLVVIQGLTKDELKEKLLTLLNSGVALSEKTVADVLDVAQFVELNQDQLDSVKNKEVKAALYDYFGVVPSKPIEFLRFVVYRATNKTLLIKNQALIDEIKGRDNIDIARYFDLYQKDNGLEPLSKIFYRYKPLFLAFRTNTKMRKSINRIRRLAKTNHEPMQEDLLNNVTARLKNREAPKPGAFNKALADASIYRKIRLAYALKFRTTDADSILYRVRNGKSFAKEFSFENKGGAEAIYDVVMGSIENDIRKNVEGKKIFIPEGIKYALPATEKQFTGDLPTGSYVEVDQNMVVGVHWENVPRHRIDLDLSISNADGKIGWDGRYRDSNQGIYFTGDITDAPKPKGATELFHVGGQARGSWIMFVNYYNFDEDVEVPFKIVVTRETRGNVEKNYTIDPNNIVALSSTSIKTKMKNLGIIVADDKSTKFYFVESDLGKAITTRGEAYSEQARKYLLNYYTDSIVLNDVLSAAGAELVGNVADADIDLSPESIDKTTILDLIRTN
jgi:hypothetical protein